MPLNLELPVVDSGYTDGYRDYGWPDAWTFSEESWVPTLQAVHEAQTSEELRDSLAFAAFAVRSRYGNYPHLRGGLQVYYQRGALIAHYETRQGSKPELRAALARAHGDRAGIMYRTSNFPAAEGGFALVESRGTSGRPPREIVRDPAAPLTAGEQRVAQLALVAFADSLNAQRSEFQIYQKLDAAGIELRP